MAQHLTLRGTLTGHNGWVTSIATHQDPQTLFETVVSGSRDKTIISWTLSRDGSDQAGAPKRSFTGHSHFVEDVILSSDGAFALSCSWDKTLRLWNLATGTSTIFAGHTNDVLSVAFSADNRQIVSGSRDRTLKLWNTLGECKHTFDGNGSHTEWVSTVRFSPNTEQPLVISGGWDKVVKVWNFRELKIKDNLYGHTGYVNTVTVSPDGSLCASGGKDGVAMLWDLNEGKHLYSLPAGSIINAMEFSPNRYWLCGATEQGIRIWDLEDKSVVCDLTLPSVAKKGRNVCISLAWSADGYTLYAGYTDGVIRVWEVRK